MKKIHGVSIALNLKRRSKHGCQSWTQIFFSEVSWVSYAIQFDKILVKFREGFLAKIRLRERHMFNVRDREGYFVKVMRKNPQLSYEKNKIASWTLVLTDFHGD